MDITYDIAKNEHNIAERGLSFDLVAELDWATGLIAIDTRKDYPETRHVMLAELKGRLHFVCYIETEAGARVLSFRKANNREKRLYYGN